MNKTTKFIQLSPYFFWGLIIVLLLFLSVQNNKLTSSINTLTHAVEQSNHLTDLSGKRRIREVNVANKKIDELTKALIMCKGVAPDIKIEKNERN